MPRLEEMFGLPDGEYGPGYDNKSTVVEVKKKKKIYVASSWRNLLQPAIVSVFRKAGHEVYDFKNPAPGNNGFSWREIHPEWQNWTPKQYKEALEHPTARAGFELDMTALRECDCCVLVLPSGRSASWEFGWAIGNGKSGAVVMLEKCEPELMYLGNPILTTMNEIMDFAGIPASVLPS